MIDTIATVVASVLGVHVIVKFAFFAIPYARRRAALDASYGDGRCATTISDRYLLAFSVAVAGLLLWRGLDGVSFLGGLWIGATLIQLYFHAYHHPVAPDRAAPTPTSPIKEMSYAIQSRPWRAWPEMLVFTVLVVAGLIALWL